MNNRSRARPPTNISERGSPMNRQLKAYPNENQTNFTKEKVMRKEHHSFLTTQRLLLAGLILAAVAVVGLPVSASANSTAGTTIMNKVTVSYTDAGGLNPFSADATTIVTVNLVKAPLTLSAAPSGNAAPGLLSCTSVATSYASGSTINFLYAMRANANGPDTSTNLSMANTPNSVNNVTVAYSVLDYQGINPVANPATRVFGAAVPIAVVSDTVLQFPGGALAGFAVNDLVAVQTTAGVRVYLVTAVSAGTAPVYSHVGNVAYTNLGSMTTPEVKGTLTLGAWGVQSITLNGAATNFGGTPAPTFASTNPATLNVPLGEMMLVKVDVTASTNSATDGTVDFTLTATDSLGANPATAPCTAGTFKAPSLSIKKEASNFSLTPGVFGATATGNPGQILEYRVTVTNTGGQASLVNVSDNVPSYTTLVTNATYGSGTAGSIFAKITDNATAPNSIELTTAVDTEVVAQPLAPVETGFGDAAGTTAASALKFWLGDTASNAAGGKLPYCSNPAFTTAATCVGPASWITTLTILYQVKID